MPYEHLPDATLPPDDWSEHGLGLYLDPSDPERPARDGKGRRVWMREAWEWILARALGESAPPLPQWADRPALTRFSLSSPRHATWFRGRDAQLPPDRRLRPGSFGLIGQLDPLSPARERVQPAAPYERNPGQWLNLDWYDRRNGGLIRVTSARPDRQPAEFAADIASGAVRLRTMAHVLATHVLRPEHKSLGPDGEPISGSTRGLLRQRPISSGRVLTRLIGKEGNKLPERLSGELSDPEDYRITYRDPSVDPWTDLVVPVLREIGARAIAAALGLSERRVRDWLAAGVRPHAGDTGNEQRAVSLAVLHALGRLMPSDLTPANPLSVLFAYLDKNRS